VIFSALIGNGPKAHSANCKIGIGFFPALKRSKRAFDHPSISKLMIKKE
jgi:hypothetical protein